MKATVVPLLLILVILVVACGQQQTNQITTTTTPTKTDLQERGLAENCADPQVLCVGLVTDVGQIDDKGFNQSAWEGVKQTQIAFGAAVQYLQPTNEHDYEDNIRVFAENQYDVIVTVGFALGTATHNAAIAYPNTHFIGVDQFQTEVLPNVAGLIFEEDKAGFLAGVLAAQLTESNTIAAVLGTNLVPPVVAFKEGYEAGARYITPAITVISTYHPGDMEIAFTDTAWGATTAQQARTLGADVLFAAGGKTGNGALIDMARSAGATFCIGVDTDQWLTLPEAHNCLVSSAIKEITPGVFDLVSQSVAGDFPSGNYIGSVGLAPFHDFEALVPQEVQATLHEVQAGLEDGSIKTGYTP